MRLFLFLLTLSSFSTATMAKDVSESDLRQHIEVLASDGFGGRKPGTLGENKTVNYIASRWAEAGLTPAAERTGWYLPVKLAERKPVTQQVLFNHKGTGKRKKIRIQKEEIIIRGQQEIARLENNGLVYVGYGNQNLEELKAAVSGKTVLLLLSSPENEDDFPEYRSRKANVIAAGASAVITIVDQKKRWNRLARFYRKPSVGFDKASEHAAIEAIISRTAAKAIFKSTGVRGYAWLDQASDENFQIRNLNLFADISVETDIRLYTSHNVLGKIPGANPAAGAVLFMGHWDHFGVCRPADDADPDKDLICNGAVDNASGISLLIETAKRLATLGLDRDIYFLATTSEESGLLGARAFVEDPVFDLSRLVAVFNADTVALAPDGKIVAVVGRGETSLDESFEKVAKVEGREIDKSDKANAFLKRQDGYAFLEKDIPALMVTSAFSDEERLNAYLKGPYHDVTDELNEDLLLGGAKDDANFHIALGKYFGSVRTYPKNATSDNLAN